MKDVVCFIKENRFDFYLKTKFFYPNKKQAINEAFIKTNLILENDSTIKLLDFDYEYYLKYDCFLVFYDKNNDYFLIDEKSIDILKNILMLNIASTVKEKGVLDKIALIRFSNNTLQTYDIDLNDIKNLIEKNNIDSNLILKNAKEDFYQIKLNSNINNIDDIKNISIFYKNKKFQQKLKDIFKIEKTIDLKSNCPMVFLDNHYALLYAIRFKYPDILSYFKIKKFVEKFNDDNFELKLVLIKPDKVRKIKIFLDKNSNLSSSIKQYQKILNILDKNNNLYFLGQDNPKISDREDFSLESKNEIVIFMPAENNKNNYKKLIHYLNDSNLKYSLNDDFCYIYDFDKEDLLKQLDNSLKYLDYFAIGTQKNTIMTYKIDEFLLNDNYLEKNDVLNTLKAYETGFSAAKFSQKDKNYRIVLKIDDGNLDNSAGLNNLGGVLDNESSENRADFSQNYIYSKKFKNFIDLDAFVQKTFTRDFCAIAKKNKRYFVKLVKVAN